MRAVPGSSEWVGDKSRFFLDAISLQRLLKPSFRGFGESFFEFPGWYVLFEYLAEQLRFKTSESILVGFFGPFLDYPVAEQAAKSFFRFSRSSNFFSPIPNLPVSDWRSNFFSIPEFFDRTDLVILVGSNPRFDSPVLNVRLRRLSQKGVPFYSFGFSQTPGYGCVTLGSLKLFSSVLEGRHPLVSILSRAVSPLFIVGGDFYLFFPTGLFELLKNRFSTSFFVYLPSTLSVFGLLECGLSCSFYGSESIETDSAFARVPFGAIHNTVVGLSSDGPVFSRIDSLFQLAPAYYVGSHLGKGFDNGCSNAIAPAVTPLEKSGFYFDLFGRLRSFASVVSSPVEAREDRIIISTFYKFWFGEVEKPAPIQSPPKFSQFLCSVSGAPFQLLLDFSSTRGFFSYRDYFGSDFFSRYSPTLSLRRRLDLNRGNYHSRI